MLSRHKSFHAKSLVLFLLGSGTFLSCRNGEETVTPEIKPLTEAVYASGHVVSDQEYQIFAQGEGVLVKKLVQEGQPIRKDQVLFVLESPQQNARLQYAREASNMAADNYRNGSPVLREAAAALQAAQAKRAYDSANFVRYQNLLQNRATSKAEYDRYALAYQNSRSEYQAQLSRYNKLKNQLYLDVQNARSNLQVAQSERGNFTVRSNINGTLLKLLKEPGELVRRSEAIAVAGQLDEFYLRLLVDELDIQRVKPGQKILVKIDAFPGKVFNGQVTKVYPMVDPQSQSLRVDAKLTDSLPGYYSGLALEANIITRQKDKALVIPRTLLLPGDSVDVEQNGKPTRVKVTKGVETLNEVEITSGLTPQTKLILPS
ncbi:efflux RND transporter periplasmic adaptor subunit [Rufibacter aurantiacus]|uniref:efflux RND transporter periplasmic adaptor subunit n=1 Tax=Rufibacter aurantiacus TaxID=2817374 RepID=UPI001B30185D|nr:efflux RND transporter periplasmic adaptor subunit [Rufibacter aurantiacus]